MSEQEFLMAGLISAAVVAVLLIVVALPVVLSMRQTARDRELQHTERLKALEVGRLLPGDPSLDSSHRAVDLGIGVWVPITAMVMALAASKASGGSEAAMVAAWISAGSVGVTGVICGAILALNPRKPPSDADAPLASAKPASEESEFDTVCRRGG